MKNRPCYTINTPVEARNGGNAIYESFNPAKAVRALYRALGTWRKVADFLDGYSPAYWCLVAHGRRPSRRAENLLRRVFGLPPRGVTRWWNVSTEDLAWYLRNRREL